VLARLPAVCVCTGALTECVIRAMSVIVLRLGVYSRPPPPPSHPPSPGQTHIHHPLAKRPLPSQDLPAPSKRRAAVVTLGQICQSAGSVMTPYWDFPQLLSLLLKLLADNRPQPGSRCEVMRVLGE
jgi:hypothetical protein